MKKVEWDKPRVRVGISNLNDAVSFFSEPVEPGMIVSAKYQGGIVYLEVLEECSPEVFCAEVRAFEYPAQTFLDLGIGDEVEINREKIGWIHFR